MGDDRSTCIFLQDGASGDRAVRSQQCTASSQSVVIAGTNCMASNRTIVLLEEGWPGNSADLNPIEELWAIV